MIFIVEHDHQLVALGLSPCSPPQPVIAGISYFSSNQFFSTDQVSPQTFIAIFDIHVPLNLTKTCTSMLHKLDTQCKPLLCFTEYIF